MTLFFTRWLPLTLVGATALGGCTGGKGDAKAPAPAIAAGVRVDAVAAIVGTLASEARFLGRVHPWRGTKVVAQTQGTVTKRSVEEGMRVEDRQVLFSIDASRLSLAVEAADVGYRARVQESSFAESEHARLVKLAARNAASDVQVSRLAHQLARARLAVEQAGVQRRTARRHLRDATVRAPHGGVAHRVAVGVGDTIGPGIPLLEVVDLEKVKIRAGVRGRDTARLRLGVEVAFVVDGIGGEIRTGTLASIAPRADPRTGLFDVEVHAENPGERVRAGMTASLLLPTEGTSSVLVPAAALTRRGGQVGVFRIEKDGAQQRARFHRVVTGDRRRGLIEIASGLNAGEVVAQSGLNALAENTVVLVTLRTAKKLDRPSVQTPVAAEEHAR